MAGGLVPISSEERWVIDEKITPGVPPSVSESPQLRPISTGIEISPLSHTHTCVPIEAALQSQLEAILAPHIEEEAQAVVDAMYPLLTFKKISKKELRRFSSSVKTEDIQKLHDALTKFMRKEVRITTIDHLFIQADRAGASLKKIQFSEDLPRRRVACMAIAMLRRILAIEWVSRELRESGTKVHTCPPDDASATFAERFLDGDGEGEVLGKGSYGVVRPSLSAPGSVVKTCRADCVSTADLTHEVGVFALLGRDVSPGSLGWFDVKEEIAPSEWDAGTWMTHPRKAKLVKVVMNRIHGPTLKDLRKGQIDAKLDASQVIKIGEKLIEKAHLLHKKGFGAGDLKDANIMMEEDNPILIDGGSYRKLGDHLAICSPNYCSPKALITKFSGDTKAILTKEHDLWSIGVTLLRAATNRPLAGGVESFSKLLGIYERVTKKDVIERVSILIARHAVGTREEKKQLNALILGCFHDSEYIAASRGGGEGE